MKNEESYESAYAAARGEVAKPLSLGSGCLDVGKRVKASKRRFFWQFMFGPEGKPYKVELIISVISGKRSLLLDGIEKVHEVSTSPDFFITLPIESHVFRVESKGEEIEACLDFIPFNEIITRDSLSRAQVEALEKQAEKDAINLLEQRYDFKVSSPPSDLIAFSPNQRQRSVTIEGNTHEKKKSATINTPTGGTIRPPQQTIDVKDATASVRQEATAPSQHVEERNEEIHRGGHHKQLAPVKPHFQLQPEDARTPPLEPQSVQQGQNQQFQFSVSSQYLPPQQQSSQMTMIGSSAPSPTYLYSVRPPPQQAFMQAVIPPQHPYPYFYNQQHAAALLQTQQQQQSQQQAHGSVRPILQPAAAAWHYQQQHMVAAAAQYQHYYQQQQQLYFDQKQFQQHRQPSDENKEQYHTKEHISLQQPLPPR